MAKPRLDWRKVHPGIDEEAQEVRALEVTSSDVGDAPMLPDLLARIPADPDIASVKTAAINPSPFECFIFQGLDLAARAF